MKDLNINKLIHREKYWGNCLHMLNSLPELFNDLGRLMNIQVHLQTSNMIQILIIYLSNYILIIY